MPTNRTSEDAATMRARIAQLERERAELEEQVRNLNRAKTTMDLLAGVAHDLAAALTGVVWCSQALCRRLESHDPELTEGVVDFMRAADFARQLARRLVLISRQPEVVNHDCKLREVVAEALDLLEILRPPKVRLRISYGECAALWVHGNADQLQQIVLNLVANAFDALQTRGDEVVVSLVPSAAPVEAQSGDDTQREWAHLSVRDNGCGMDAQILERVFEPFFTTKDAQAGSGMGLVVVKRVVDRHGGVMRIESAFGQGTTVDVFLPTTHAPEQ